MKKYTIENLMQDYYATKDKGLGLAPYAILAKVVKGKNYTTPQITQAFDETMERADFLKSERTDIIKHLKRISSGEISED